MLTVRLTKDLETALAARAKIEHLGKSEIVKRAIREYIAKRENELSSYELGKDLFGSSTSGRTDLSTNYKKIMKQSLRAKHNR